MEKVNSMFYTDTIDEDVVINFELDNKYDIDTFKERWQQATDELEEKVLSLKENGVQNIYTSLILDSDMGFISFDDPKYTLKCHISGSKPWSNEKIKEFETAVGEEKDDIKMLKALLDKYPQKSVELFAKVMLEKLEDV